MKESTAGLFKQVTLWTFIGLGYFLLLEAVVVGTLSLLSWVAPRAANVLMALGALATPGVGYALARRQLDPKTKWAERNGLWVAVMLVYGFAILFVFVSIASPGFR